VQLAKHAASPLLWFVDLATLWQTLAANGRARALDSARRAGAARYLVWALAIVERLPAAAAGDVGALRALGVDRDGTIRRGHNALRVASLADSPLAALRVGIAWSWPNDRGRAREFMVRRVRRLLARSRGSAEAIRTLPPASATAPDVARTVDGPGLVDAVRTVVADAGGGLWVRAHGQSMAPAVPSGARVHLAPLRPTGPRRGDVVFAVAPPGAIVHRVVARWGSRVVLQGDTMAWSDPPMHSAQVLAAVDAVELPSGVEPIGRRPRPGLVRQLRRTPRQLGVLFGLVTAAPPGAARA
jgi:hypothetical protein